MNIIKYLKEYNKWRRGDATDIIEESLYEDYTRDDIKSIIDAYNIRIVVGPTDEGRVAKDIFIYTDTGAFKFFYLTNCEQKLNEWLINYDRQQSEDV